MSFGTQTRAVMEYFFSKIKVIPETLIVLGLTTSEIAGGIIGKASVPEIGSEAVAVVLEMLRERGADLAVQCCEHLNRALVVERRIVKTHGLTQVSAVPYATAGGGAATAAFALMEAPVLVESIQADAGIDVGVTMIGMHIRSVVVPVRCPFIIGSARVDFAFARPKLIGGERAKYV